jgi:hypothetical protein
LPMVLTPPHWPDYHRFQIRTIGTNELDGCPYCSLDARTQIRDLTTGEETARTDTMKAEILMDTFFPVPPEPEGGTAQTRTQGQSVEWPELTLPEVKEAIIESSLDKAP